MMTHATDVNILWQPPSTLPYLADDEVHVWCAALTQPSEQVLQLAQTLSPDEAERAQRFVFDHDREYYIVGRGFLRHILAHYRQTDPAGIKFNYGPQGKPGLAPTLNSDIQFNLSHSGSLVLYAITRRHTIGVDIEAVRPLDDMAQIAKRFFSPVEAATLLKLPLEEQPEGFFNCWTRKEAFIKASGKGLSQPLDEFDVTLAPGQPARLLRVQDDSQAPYKWSLTHLIPATGYVAALAVAGQMTKIFCRQWAG